MTLLEFTHKQIDLKSMGVEGKLKSDNIFEKEITSTTTYNSVLNQIKSKYPALVGSPKQVKWAEFLRNKFAHEKARKLVYDQHYLLNRNIIQNGEEVLSDTQKKSMHESFVSSLTGYKNTSAAWWIDTYKSRQGYSLPENFFA